MKTATKSLTIEEIMEHGSMIGCFEEWEYWQLGRYRYHVNVKTWQFRIAS